MMIALARSLSFLLAAALLAVILLAGCSSSDTEKGEDAGIEVMAGTSLRILLITPLSTATNTRGDTFSALLAKPLIYKGKVLLPKETEVRGLIKRSVKISDGANDAMLLLLFDQVVLPDATIIPLAASLDNASSSEVIKVKGEKVKELKVVSTGSLVGYLIGTKGRKKEGAKIVAGSMAGVGAVLISTGNDIKLPPQTELRIKLDDTLILPRQ
jgi:hypothetical protein